MSLRFSHSSFPCTPEQKSACALPWGCLLTPLAPLPTPSITRLLSTSVDRCATCFAYINPYVTWVRAGWKCSLCRAVNSASGPRYRVADDRLRLPELIMNDIEYAWVDEHADTRPNHTATAEEEQHTADAIEAYRQASDFTSASYDPSATLSAPFAPATTASLSPPAYLFLVDLSGDYNYVELLKSSLLAAIEALPPSVWVGLAVVSSKLGLYDLRCSTPTVSYVSLRSAEAAQQFGPSLDEQPISISLHAVMSIDHFLQQLEHCKEHLCAAIESLATHQPKVHLQDIAREVEDERDFEAGGAAAAASPSAASRHRPSATPPSRVHPFGFGSALSALLAYLGSVEEQGFETNIRILSFLSQRPNWGLGALEDRMHGRDQDGNPVQLNEDDFNRFLLQPNDATMAWSGVDADERKRRGHVSSRTGGEFYREVGAACSQRGICIDTYLVASSPQQYFDLATLKYLSVLTGGNMIYYDSLGECTLPQDLFRQLRLTQGFRCLMRMRTSPEFQATDVYGHLVADEAHDGLFHLGGCDARKVYAIDWDFCGAEGFKGGYVDVVPVIQVAFSYIGVRVVDGVECVEHRLRVLTRQLPLVHFYAPGPGGSRESREALRTKSMHQAVSELYACAAPEVVLALLVHQVIHASLERGVLESRELVKDWLVHFVRGYHQIFAPKRVVPPAGGGGGGESKEDDSSSTLLTPDSLDLAFSRVESLQFLPRFIFALLKSPLLSLEKHVASADTRVYLQCLYSGLEADFLVKTIYPTLTSFKADLTHATNAPTDATLQQKQSLVRVSLHHPVLHLTRYSLSGCGDHVFVLDTFRQLFVLHTGPVAANPSLMPLPPPSHSEVAKHLKRVKSSTPYLTPRVACCAEVDSPALGGYSYAQSGTAGRQDATMRAILAYLIEDEVSAAGPAGFGYQTFLAEVGKEVCEAINEEDAARHE